MFTLTSLNRKSLLILPPRKLTQWVPSKGKSGQSQFQIPEALYPGWTWECFLKGVAMRLPRLSQAWGWPYKQPQISSVALESWPPSPLFTTTLSSPHQAQRIDNCFLKLLNNATWLSSVPSFMSTQNLSMWPYLEIRLLQIKSKLSWSYWIRLGLNPMTGVLISRGNLDQRHPEGRRPCGDRGRDWSRVASQGTPQTASEYQKLEGGKERSSPEPSEGHGPATGNL